MQINIGKADQELVANKSIKQVIEMVTPSDKFDKLKTFLKAADPASRILVFANQKRVVQEVADQLWADGLFIDAIHGDKSQGEREYALNQFKKGDVKILVATDVAARGLDIKGVDFVVNFDFPMGADDYIHRIGRTGRAGASGTQRRIEDKQDKKTHQTQL